MEKIVILHNKHDKESIEFVDTFGEGYKVIDWYSGGKDVEDYIRCELCSPQTFPTVVDTELKIWSIKPVSMEAALSYISDWTTIDGEPIKLNGATKESKYKELKIKSLSGMSFSLRQTIIPEYKLTNALLDIYDADTKAKYKLTCEAFRTEFYRVKALIESAETMETIKAAFEGASFPTAISTLE